MVVLMEPVELLRKLVSINSVFPNERELAGFLVEELERYRFDVRLQEFGEGRVNVLAERGSSGKPLLLYAHMDTIPAYGYDEVGRKRDPFVLEERDGRLYGLGAYDMKAGIAAILKAVENAENDRAIKIMFVSDEEADSQGCYEVTKTDFLKDVGFVISTEISDVGDANEATRTITLGRRGRVQYEIEIPGKSYHAAKMENGVSAVTEASKIAIELEKMNSELPKHPQLSQGNQFVRRIFSESVSLSVPDRATMLVDRHLVLPETAESARLEIEARLNQMYDDGVLNDVGRRATVLIKPREVPYLMPYVISQDNPNVHGLAKTISDKFGVEANYNYGMSVADDNFLAMAGLPVLVYGPIGSGEHSNEEWVSKKSYLELIEVLKEFVES
jgi:succinyl-diaminopimelate desuccinylase